MHRPAAKLPVPAQWQPPVERAIADLMARQGLSRDRVAVTRVEEAAWSAPDETTVHGLDIWLLAAARTYRYYAALTADQVVPVPAPDRVTGVS